MPILIQSACVKVNFSWNFRCSAKEAVILLRPCSTLYIALSKCKVSWFQLFYSDLSLFTQSVCIKGIYSQIFRCSAKEAVILLLSWSTRYVAFSKCMMPDLKFFILNCHCSPKVHVWESFFIFGSFRCSAKEAMF